MRARGNVGWAVLGLLLAAPLAAGGPPAPMAAVPTASQLAWQRGEISIFLHFGVNTFTDREWGEGKEDPRLFNPTQLDAGQWVRAAKAAGAQMVILTAKHHDGFCLWPSKYTEHSVKNSPWRGGRGDVVGELAKACREGGIKLGLYLSPWDRHEKTYGDSPRYNRYYLNQLTELLTQYGPIAEVWFDGACGEGPNGKRQQYDWPAVHATVRKLQPQAVMFSDAGPDVRWIGNEAGTAGDPCWATVDPARVPFPGFNGKGVIDALQHGDRDGSIWRPGESDVSIRPGWFWHASQDAKVRSVDNLVDLYFKSVGRNSLLLLNVPPNTKGLLSDVDVQRLTAFRDRLNQIFAKDLAAGRAATASNRRGGAGSAGAAEFGPAKALDADPDSYWATDDPTRSAWLEVDLGSPVTFSVAAMQEAIALGQRVESYQVQVEESGQWRTVSRGTTIGHKKLDRFQPVTARRVRLAIDGALAPPAMARFAIYP